VLNFRGNKEGEEEEEPDDEEQEFDDDIPENETSEDADANLYRDYEEEAEETEVVKEKSEVFLKGTRYRVSRHSRASLNVPLISFATTFFNSSSNLDLPPSTMLKMLSKSWISCTSRLWNMTTPHPESKPFLKMPRFLPFKLK
jgi:hypothetical protein